MGGGRLLEAVAHGDSTDSTALLQDNFKFSSTYTAQQ